MFNFEGPVKETSKKVSGTGTGNRGGIAQLGEHLLCKQGVKGSIPLISTKYRLKDFKCPEGDREIFEN